MTDHHSLKDEKLVNDVMLLARTSIDLTEVCERRLTSDCIGLEIICPILLFLHIVTNQAGKDIYGS